MFDRDTFFEYVRDNPFSGSLSQSQVDGMNGILDAWVANPRSNDLRWLAYALATAYHETSQEMQPIEEYGKGSGMEYGKTDPKTGYAYYGRGYVQLTWSDNYKKADKELLSLEESGENSCYWNPKLQLTPQIAADTMFEGMEEGWFRSDSNGKQTLYRYFNETDDDPYGAREIINGDKTKVPSWSGGVSIGNLIKKYHYAFLEALIAAADAYDQEQIVVPPVEAIIIEPGDPDAPEHMPSARYDDYVIRVPAGTEVKFIKVKQL
jgi:putative chitinase